MTREFRVEGVGFKGLDEVVKVSASLAWGVLYFLLAGFSALMCAGVPIMITVKGMNKYGRIGRGHCVLTPHTSIFGPYVHLVSTLSSSGFQYGNCGAMYIFTTAQVHGLFVSTLSPITTSKPKAL